MANITGKSVCSFLDDVGKQESRKTQALNDI